MHPRYLTAVLVIHFKQNSHQEVRFMKQNMHTPPLQRFRMHMHESRIFLCCLGSFSWLRSDVRRRMILKGDTVCSCPLVLGLSTSHLCRCRSEPINGLSSTKDASSWRWSRDLSTMNFVKHATTCQSHSLLKSPCWRDESSSGDEHERRYMKQSQNESLDQSGFIAIIQMSHQVIQICRFSACMPRFDQQTGFCIWLKGSNQSCTCPLPINHGQNLHAHAHCLLVLPVSYTHLTLPTILLV